MTHPISNMDDVIDSRAVIARIEELEAICRPIHNVDTGEDEMDPAYTADEREGAAEELAALEALADDASQYAEDWQYGETLIRDSYFREYAQELAEDCDMLPKNASWPCNCIDWDEAARQLKMDYTSVDFDGVTYWVR
jgi:hypothetical protein